MKGGERREDDRGGGQGEIKVSRRRDEREGRKDGWAQLPGQRRHVSFVGESRYRRPADSNV